MACPQCGYALPSDVPRCPTCGMAASVHQGTPAEAHGATRGHDASSPPGGPPPWTASFGRPARPVRPPRPIHGRAVAVIVALSICIVAEVLWSVVNLIQSSLIGSRLAGDKPSIGALDTNDALFDLSSALLLCVLVATAVTFLVWLFRAHANAEALGRPQWYGRMWLILGWVLPAACFFIPKQIIDGLWLTARAGVAVPAGRAGRRSGLVRLWWAFYLVNFFGPQVAAGVLRLRGGDLEVQRGMALLEVAAAPFGIAAAALAIVIVRQISDTQESRRLTPGAEHSPAT